MAHFSYKYLHLVINKSAIKHNNSRFNCTVLIRLFWSFKKRPVKHQHQVSLHALVVSLLLVFPVAVVQILQWFYCYGQTNRPFWCIWLRKFASAVTTIFVSLRVHRQMVMLPRCDFQTDTEWKKFPCRLWTCFHPESSAYASGHNVILHIHIIVWVIAVGLL